MRTINDVSMQLDEARLKFIQAWGNLGVNWGVCKTMGQVHGLLLVATEPLCADELMQELQISRGNANMNVRALIDWGLVHKACKQGERKDFYVAEKDIWKVLQQIIEQRRRKELDPMIKVLDELAGVEPGCDKSDEFCKMVRQLQTYAYKADNALSALSKSENNWLMSGLMRMI